MYRRILAFLIFLATGFCAICQTKLSVPREQIDSIITSQMSANKMVGLSMGIVSEGEIYLAKGYGSRQIDEALPVDSLTNYLACSVTKLFTATAIMQLAEQGKIDISKKLVYYLPDFKMKDPRYTDITIEQMLTHTSGLYWDMELKHSPNDSSALRKLVYSLDNKILDFAPGTKFNAVETYSNAAYDILGYLVQKISGMQYEDYIQQHILVQTNMVNTTLDYKKIPAERRSAPHILKGKAAKQGGMYTENREHTPSGNLNSCAYDLCNWMIHNLNIYNAPASFKGILQYSTLINMWTPRHIAPQNKRVSIGLGWFMKDSEELGTYYWHVGDNPGFSATLMIFPEHNFGITILTNGMYAEDIIWNNIPFNIIDLFKNDWKK